MSLENKNRITIAIIPVAGYGTRRLPITKAIEKSMLPIGNRPIVDYVVADCIAAGINDVWFVVGEESTQIREYFGHNQKLEKYLKDKNKTAALEQIQPPKNITFHYVRQTQDSKYGTTIPVALGLAEIAKSRQAVQSPNPSQESDLTVEKGENLSKEVTDFSESILVVMGDDFLYYHDEELSGRVPRCEIIAQHSDFKRLVGACSSDDTAAMLAAQIAPAEVSRYGVIDRDEQENFVGIVEKPTVDEAPSNLINISKYVFPPRLLELVMKYAGDDAPTHDGEYFITDPINAFVEEGGRVKVITAGGEYLDGGNLAGWLHANEVVGRDLLKSL